MSEKEALIERINELTGWTINPKRFRIFTDTSEWMDISRGSIIRLGNVDYLVKGNMNEPRFGIDDQPKYWVFNAIQLDNGDEKIIKTVFHEEFIAHVGIFKIRCYRSPEKESQTLDTTRLDERFMQGFTMFDEKGNNVRVIDYIKGAKFFHYIPSIPKAHYEYFETELPRILSNLYYSFKAIADLHAYGLCHGDIRNDHIIIESDTGNYRWIDFDLKQDVTDFDLWSIGNLICYAAAKGIATFDNVIKSPDFSREIKDSLRSDDSSAFYEYRVMNLKKIYPYLPDRLSKILQHFTIKPIAYYTSISEFLEEYRDMLLGDFRIKTET